MRKTAIVTTLLLILAACGGGDGGDASADTDTVSGGTSASNGQDASSGGGDVVDPQPPGQAKVVVDGREYTLTESGNVDCSITAEAITFGFRIGDNEVTLGGGANLYDDGWSGAIDLTVWNPEGEDAPIDYSPDLVENANGITVDGASMSYSGPWKRNDPDDPGNLDGISVGDGTVSVTCG
jgi:hypothetical protein